MIYSHNNGLAHSSESNTCLSASFTTLSLPAFYSLFHLKNKNMHSNLSRSTELKEKHSGMANTIKADFITPSVFINGTKSYWLMAEEYYKNYPKTSIKVC